MWWLLLVPAFAHQPGLSYARVEPDRLVLTFAQQELDALVPIGDPRAKALITEATLRKATVLAGGQPCTLGEASVERVEADGVEVSAPLDCGGVGDWTLQAGYLQGLRGDHRHFVEAFGQPVATLDPEHRDVTFDGQAHAAEVGMRFTELGVEHILTGWDHLAFVAALLLGARGWRQVLLLVTTFTVAHSITLALASLRLVTLSSSIVEPLIAASIAFVGIENLWQPPIRRRAVLTFLFGLIHGLGFAGLLAELGLPRDHLALALVTFNVGVELGQIGVVLLAGLALGWLQRQARWEDRVRPGLSLGLALAGVYWLVERVAGG